MRLDEGVRTRVDHGWRRRTGGVPSRRTADPGTAVAVLALAAAASVAGCAEAREIPVVAQLGGNTPMGVVSRMVDAMGSGDYALANSFVCPPLRTGSLPIAVGPVLLPFGSLPDVDEHEALALLHLDLSQLHATEHAVGADESSVDLAGAVRVTYDVAGARALATRLTNSDQDAIDRVMLVMGDGHLTVSSSTTLSLVRQDGVWQVCDPGAVQQPGG